MSIDKLIKDINKKFGVNAIRRGVDIKERMNFKIPLGSVSLNEALGGGLPSGRYITLAGVESSGKSLLAYKAIASVQQMRKKLVKDSDGFEYEVVSEDGDIPLRAALIQIECGSYSEEWGAVHGIDNESLLFCQPEGMEQALDIAVALQQAGVEFIVIDSIAAMLPTKEIETELSESVQMGLRAKSLNSYHGKFQSYNNYLERNGKLPTTVLAINQLREKIGVMYGDTSFCLHGETNVVFTDGRTIPIEKVVKERIEGKVWALNEKTNTFEAREIVDWYYNGKLGKGENFYTITANGVGSKNGVYSVTTTADHKILTKQGWKQACDITTKDKLVTYKGKVVNGTLKDFLAGTLVGDCSLFKRYNTASISFRDSTNTDYLNWKICKLSKAFNFHYKERSGIFTSNFTVELGDFKEELTNNRDVRFFFKRYSDLGLALWYMDDGSKDLDRERSCISIGRFKKNTEILKYVEDFFNGLGMECSVYKDGKIQFTIKGSQELYKRIYKFIPPCMQYKLPESFRGKYEDFELTFERKAVPRYVEVLNAGVSQKRKFRCKHLYDLHVQENHNYLAGGTGNGLVVHNCPGGNSQRYANSLEIRLRPGDYLKDGVGSDKRVVARTIKWKLQKNKVGTAFQDGEYDLYIDDALLPRGTIDTAKELVTLAIIKGIIERRGAWYYYNNEQVAQGQENVISLLRSNEELFKEVVSKI